MFQAQVHLLGNLAIWYAGTLSIVSYSALLTFYLLRRRRLCFDISEQTFDKFVNAGEVLLGGYLIHYLPFWFYDRTLFVHHYLSAYVFKLMLTAFVVSHLHELITKVFNYPKLGVIFIAATVAWLALAAYVFWRFSVLAYGFVPLTAEEVKALQWKDSWDLIVHKP